MSESKGFICPDPTGIKAGDRYSLWVKTGGEMALVMVICRCAPYPVTLGNGGTALYVDVFGYGVRKSVNVKKLRARPVKEESL